MDSTTQKKQRLLLVTIMTVVILIQLIMGVFYSIREFQYYGRLFYLIEINIMLTLSLALINGFTGQFSIGHAAFMAIGAYSSILITTIIPRHLFGAALTIDMLMNHFFFVLSLLFGGLVAGVFGFIIGFPSLRLRGDYLAIVTLAAGELIRTALRLVDFLGGPRGVPGIPKFTNTFYLGFAFIITILIIRNLLYSHQGRAYGAIRDSEIAASSLGINVTFHKVSAFVIGACIAGVSGGLYAHMNQYINPDNFNLFKSLDLLIFLYIGGFSTISGSIIGAGLFTLVPEILRIADLEQWRMVAYPLILIIAIRFKHNGIMGNYEFNFLIPMKYRALQIMRIQS